jgi:methylated-DNA-protein-cysteine methyltransferase-like protein
VSNQDSSLDARHRIWQVVAAIPVGKVASYGQVAQLAGLGRGARQVGHVLKRLPEGTRIPWHRVINSQGNISLPAGSPAYYIQKERLEAEGVEVSPGGKIQLRRFRWQP